MKITEITYSLKKGLPNYSSVSAGITIQVEEGENTLMAWETAKREVMAQCNEDAAWVNQKLPGEKPYVALKPGETVVKGGDEHDKR